MKYDLYLVVFLFYFVLFCFATHQFGEADGVERELKALLKGERGLDDLKIFKIVQVAKVRFHRELTKLDAHTCIRHMHVTNINLNTLSHA